MSDAVIVALIIAVPPTLAALINLLYIRSLHLQINSRMDQLIRIVAKNAKAEGVIEGKARNT